MNKEKIRQKTYELFFYFWSCILQTAVFVHNQAYHYVSAPLITTKKKRKKREGINSPWILFQSLLLCSAKEGKILFIQDTDAGSPLLIRAFSWEGDNFIHFIYMTFFYSKNCTHRCAHLSVTSSDLIGFPELLRHSRAPNATLGHRQGWWSKAVLRQLAIKCWKFQRLTSAL